MRKELEKSKAQAVFEEKQTDTADEPKIVKIEFYSPHKGDHSDD